MLVKGLALAVELQVLKTGSRLFFGDLGNAQ